MRKKNRVRWKIKFHKKLFFRAGISSDWDLENRLNFVLKVDWFFSMRNLSCFHFCLHVWDPFRDHFLMSLDFDFNSFDIRSNFDKLACKIVVINRVCLLFGKFLELLTVSWSYLNSSEYQSKPDTSQLASY